VFVDRQLRRLRAGQERREFIPATTSASYHMINPLSAKILLFHQGRRRDERGSEGRGVSRGKVVQHDRCTYLAGRGALNEGRRKFNGGSHTAKSESSTRNRTGTKLEESLLLFGVEDSV
jgi:hypothetical protein